MIVFDVVLVGIDFTENYRGAGAKIYGAVGFIASITTDFFT
jgi:hypothetical protein